MTVISESSGYGGWVMMMMMMLMIRLTLWVTVLLLLQHPVRMCFMQARNVV